ncbi:RNA-binding S4 domain-containing protein [Amygdalobacter nucleatus]|uniref:RNA-binding S4 domain-containing protein n=1 Tax=Amygdalobacter nucleatus TaxID=3029274 RepID=UPI0027AB76A2|nr:RNA-binding S4 domain-containing protein [Amygdalobacter nucleatus]WEG36762.1 RNA-binding S4 domain-containing protein [Amygdalobacter nucleatus]
MRIDKFLKLARIIKRRTVANEMCDAGRVSLNGRVCKASAEINVGDEISLRFGTGEVKFRIKEIKDVVRKEEAYDLYEQI